MADIIRDRFHDVIPIRDQLGATRTQFGEFSIKHISSVEAPQNGGIGLSEWRFSSWNRVNVVAYGRARLL